MRKLSGKTINSLALCVALAAPLVYLFGTLFMTLAGSHGEQMLAQPVYTEEYVETETFVKDGSTYKLEILSESYPSVFNNNALSIPFDFTYNGETYNSFRIFGTNSDWLRFYKSTDISGENVTLIREGVWQVPHPVIIYTTDLNPLVQNQYTKLYKTIEVPTSVTPENAGAYSDYLFNQFFTYDNFLAESGREVLNGTPLYGFEPIGELVRYTDENMLHLANLSYGPLVIGYTYYCAHVIIVDLIFYIGSFIPRLIKKTINKLEGGLD